MGSQDLQQARYDQLVRRVGALYGGGSKVVEVLPEVFPVLELEGTTPELLALSGWRLAWQNITQNAVAAQTSAVSLTNPAGSGIIVAVEELHLRTDVVDNIQMLVTDTLLVSAAIRGLFRDGRLGGNRNTTCELRSDPNVATGGGPRLFLNGNEPIFVRPTNGVCVLSPGTALQVGGVNSQVTLAVTYFWRERLAQESELNFP